MDHFLAGPQSAQPSRHAYHAPAPHAAHWQPVSTAAQLQDVQLDALRFCHLKTQHDIAQVLHLRQQIQLPTAALSDPDFAAREKKETNSVLWADSAAGASSLARSVSFR